MQKNNWNCALTHTSSCYSGKITSACFCATWRKKKEYDTLKQISISKKMYHNTKKKTKR